MNKKLRNSETERECYFHVYTKCEADYKWMTSFLHWRGIKTTPGTKKNQFGNRLCDQYVVSMHCTRKQFHDIQSELKGKVGNRGSSFFQLK